MSLADVKKAFKNIVEGRLTAMGASPQLRAKVELQLKDLDSIQTAVMAWGGASAILKGLAGGATGDLGCCTYFIDGEKFRLTTTKTEHDTIPSNPPGSFDTTGPCS
jgi:hypothetical protein